MLGELFELANAFEREKLTPPQEHPRVKQPGKSTGPCLRIHLDARGDVVGIDRVSEEEWGGLWTVMEGNHNSFPVVRLKEPFLSAGPDDAVAPKSSSKRQQLSIEARRARLLAALEEFSVSPGVATRELMERLRTRKAPELRTLSESRPGLVTVEALTSRFVLATTDLPGHLRQILTAIRAALIGDPTEGLVEASDALVFGSPAKAGVGRETSIQLAYEAAGYVGETYTRTVRGELISALLDADVVSTPEGLLNDQLQAECAYAGSMGQTQTGPFPTVTLPILGRAFPLVSMFSEAACNQRYGLTDSAIIPVAPATALRLQDALKEIVSEGRQDENWRGIASGRYKSGPGGKRELQDLLIVYPAAEPNFGEGSVDLFAQNPRKLEISFKSRAAVVCEALRGLAQRHPSSRLHLFVIRRVSEGQVQIAVSESPKVEEVIEGARLWQEGARNVPPFSLPIPPVSGGSMIRESPSAPYPEQVIKLLQEQWLRDGATRKRAGGDGRHPFQPVPGPGLRDVLNLMLDPHGRGRASAGTLLGLTLQRVGPLMIGLSGASIRDDKNFLQEYPPDARRVVLRACSVLGICLQSLGSRKEVYVTQSAFDIGRLLALADILHRDYCVVVRDGAMPPTLIGNAVLGTAFQNPAGALAELAERIRLYVGWAETVKIPDPPSKNAWAIRQARRTLQRFQPIAERLHNGVLITTCTDEQKAHMLLGYLASPKLEDDDQENKNGDQ